MKADERVELVAEARFHSAYVGAKIRGDFFSCHPKHAQHLLEQGLARLANKPAGPQETKPAGPQEKQPAKPGESRPGGPAERKKFSGTATTIRSIVSRSSSVPGLVSLAQFSAAGQALRTATRSFGSRIGSIVRAGRSRF